MLELCPSEAGRDLGKFEETLLLFARSELVPGSSPSWILAYRHRVLPRLALLSALAMDYEAGEKVGGKVSEAVVEQVVEGVGGEVGEEADERAGYQVGEVVCSVEEELVCPAAGNLVRAEVSQKLGKGVRQEDLEHRQPANPILKILRGFSDVPTIWYLAPDALPVPRISY